MPYSNNRVSSISEEVRKALDSLMREELRDPRFSGTFSITHADVTRDLRYCKVYISVLEPEKRQDTMAALKSAAGFLRRELGRRVDLRYTPELLFELDTNIEYASRMTRLIDDAVKTDERKASEASESNESGESDN